jgi:CrcB protein
MFKAILFVGVGSFVGGSLRYVLSKYVQDLFNINFPLGTFLVNIIGCLVIGFCYGAFLSDHVMDNNMRLLLTTGFCGGFTTFSTFINENYDYIKDQHFFLLAFYTSLSLFVGLLMLYLGYSLAKLL